MQAEVLRTFVDIEKTADTVAGTVFVVQPAAPHDAAADDIGRVAGNALVRSRHVAFLSVIHSLLRRELFFSV